MQQGGSNGDRENSHGRLEFDAVVVFFRDDRPEDNLNVVAHARRHLGCRWKFHSKKLRFRQFVFDGLHFLPNIL